MIRAFVFDDISISKTISFPELPRINDSIVVDGVTYKVLSVSFQVVKDETARIDINVKELERILQELKNLLKEGK